MKKTILIVAALALAGCSGLHVQWALQATYNMPKAEAPAAPVVQVDKLETPK